MEFQEKNWLTLTKLMQQDLKLQDLKMQDLKLQDLKLQDLKLSLNPSQWLFNRMRLKIKEQFDGSTIIPCSSVTNAIIVS